MQYPKAKPNAKNPYTIEKVFVPVASNHTHEVHTRQNGCVIITRHYGFDEAERERQLQMKWGYTAEVVPV